MRVKYKINEHCEVEFDASGELKLFQALAGLDSVFRVRKCGNCDSPHLRLLHRTPQGYDFYSVQCLDCHYELKFGQTKETHKLYPKEWEEPYQSDRPAGNGRQRSAAQGHYETPEDDQYGPHCEDPQAADGIPF